MEKLKGNKHGRLLKQHSSGLLLVSLFFIGIVGAGFTPAPENVRPAITSPQSAAPNADLIIKLENVRNSKGKLRLALYKGQDGYPDNSKKAARLVSVQAKEGTVEVVVEGLPTGNYAVALLHDENENGEMDTNMVGYPKEGYGFSNNNLPAFRAPRYDEAAFELTKSKQELAIRIRY